MNGSLMELWAVMGPFAKGIVLLLLAMSVLSVAVACERLLALRAAARELPNLVRLAKGLVLGRLILVIVVSHVNPPTKEA